MGPLSCHAEILFESFNIEAMTPCSCCKQAFCVRWTRMGHTYRTLRREHERRAAGARTRDEHERRGRATSGCNEHEQGTQEHAVGQEHRHMHGCNGCY